MTIKCLLCKYKHTCHIDKEHKDRKELEKKIKEQEQIIANLKCELTDLYLHRC